MKTTSIITAIADNKQQVAAFVLDVKGQMDLMTASERLKFYSQVKMAEKVIKDLVTDDEVDEMLLQAADNYHAEELKDLFGCKFEKREVGTKYDYSQTDDSLLFELEVKKSELEKQIKERQKMLQNINGELYGADGVQIRKPIKSSKTKLVVTIK